MNITSLVSNATWAGRNAYRSGASTPGANLLAFCTGFGWIIRGPAGALVALLASSIPCALLVAGLTAVFSYWQNNPSRRLRFKLTWDTAKFRTPRAIPCSRRIAQDCQAGFKQPIDERILYGVQRSADIHQL
jgi:hypothetical protein